MMKKVSKLLILSAPFVFILIIFGGMSYAYMQYTQSFASTNSMKTSCYSFETVEEYSDVTISNGIPVSDEDGLLSEPYRMKITNKCTTAMTVQAVMNVQSSSTMSDSYVKAALDNQVHSLTSDNKITNSLPSGTRSAYTIGSIVLAPKETKEVMVRAWISQDVVDGQAENATFVGKVTFNFEQSTLGARIINNSTLKTTTPDFSLGEPPLTGTNTGSGLYSTQDENGTSYYYRGDINDNYVSFANRIWRIVRVNGNGTIRLILDEATGMAKAFNTTSNGSKYVGYTYDNDHVCTKENPCTSTTGTNSIIKDYLENVWYENNLKSYDDFIAESSFCNDTSYKTEQDKIDRVYISYHKIYGDELPSLICGDTTEAYGGYYKLKVGLLTVDEMILSGFPNEYAVGDNNNYLNKKDYSNNNVGMSPLSSWANQAKIWYYTAGMIDATFDVSSSFSVYPVINLKADLLISSGDGTKDKPYVVRAS